MQYGINLLYRIFAYATKNVMGTITSVNTQEPVAALTFDDGPHPEFTPRLLDILERHDARGTFFMLGTMAQKHPEVVRRAAEGGHAVCNHSWDHPSFPLIPRRERVKQIRACAKALEPYEHQLFRPPYGHQTLASSIDTLRLGYQIVGWNLIGKDWLDFSPEWMANRVISQIQPGCIINFHDALYTAIEDRYANREPMLAAMALILGHLSEQYRFVTVPELLRYGRPHKRHHHSVAATDFLNNLKAQEGGAWRYGQEGSAVRSENRMLQ
jgi:peptidoglycan/xylan/chitin deacetylase (PgdA/CDA1 family)